MAEYSVQQVVASGCTDALVAFRLGFPTPVWEVISIQKTVLIDRAGVTLGSALLQGRLCACYTAAVPSGGDRSLPPSPKRPPAAGLLILQAALQAVRAEQPFTVAIPLPGAEPAMDLTVTAAHVVDQSVHPVWSEHHPMLAALDDQSLIHLAVRLTRPVDLSDAEGAVPAGTPGSTTTPRAAAPAQTPAPSAFPPAGTTLSGGASTCFPPAGTTPLRAAFARFRSGRSRP